MPAASEMATGSSASLQARATARPPVPRNIISDLIAAAPELESLGATEREQVVLAKQGQGHFRDALLKAFGGRCALTGLSFEPVLRASHIKPWRDSSNTERLDVNNGLLLRADVDALFDGGHISFDVDGSLIVAASTPEAVATSLGLTDGMGLAIGALTPTRLKALASHRDHIFLSRRVAC